MQDIPASHHETRICIGVCTFRRPEMLTACLESLMLQVTSNGLVVMIAVVDNEPRPNNRGIVNSLRARSPLPIQYIHEHRRGIAVARNRVIDAALGHNCDWIAFIDDDEVADPYWIAELMAPEYRDVPVLVGKRTHTIPKPVPFWHVARAEKNREGRPSNTAATSNVRFSRALLDAGLRFDESLGLAGGEDTLFFAQARLAGFEIRRTDRALTLETAHRERLTYFGQMYREYWSGAVGTKKAVLLKGRVRGMLLHNIPAVLLIAPGLIELALSPLFTIAGLTAFKRRALAGGKKIARGIGRAVSIAGHLPQPYRRVHGS